eukprot:3847705-Prymnesium_polylepis.1
MAQQPSLRVPDAAHTAASTPSRWNVRHARKVLRHRLSLPDSKPVVGSVARRMSWHVDRCACSQRGNVEAQPHLPCDVES